MSQRSITPSSQGKNMEKQVEVKSEPIKTIIFVNKMNY